MSADEPVTQRLTVALDAAGVGYTRMEHQPVYTSAEAASVRGTSLHSGAKALIMKAENRFVMLVMPADLGLDNNAVRRLLGVKRLRFADKEELLTLTGLTPGSVPPMGSLFGIETICDERLAENESINFNAGSHSESLKLRYGDYIAFESPRIARIAKPQTRKG